MTRVERQLSTLCAVAAGLISLLGCAARWLHLPWLAAAGGMVPSSAAGLLILSLGLLWQLWCRQSGWRWVVDGLVGAGTLVCVVLAGRVPGWPNINPTSAGSLILMMGVLVSAQRPRASEAGLGVALLLLGAHGVLLMGRIHGMYLLPDFGESPPSIATTFVFVALSLGLVLVRNLSGWFFVNFMGEEEAQIVLDAATQQRRRWSAVRIGGLVGVVLSLGLFSYLGFHVRQVREEIGPRLTNVADLKVAQIINWRKERIGDARVLMRDPFLVDALDPTALRRGDGVFFPRILAYFSELERNYGYESIALFDRSRKCVLTIPATAGSSDLLAAEVAHSAATSGDVTVVDLHRDAAGKILMEFVVPVRGPDGVINGYLQLQVNARQQLMPYVRLPFTMFGSEEALLVRRQGLEVEYLNPLRFNPKAVLNLHFPTSQLSLPAARAVVERRVELSEGIDYRGVPVFWVSRPVFGSPWVLLAKADCLEVYATVQTEIWSMVACIVSVLVVLGLLFGNFWRNRQRVLENEHYVAVNQRHAAAQRLALVMRHANDVFFLYDAEMRIVEANDRASQLYGYTGSELLQLTAAQLRAVDSADATERDFSSALIRGGLVFETTHQRKDGTTFPVEVSSKSVKIEGKSHVFSIVRDISERKQLLETLGREEARFRSVFDHAPVGISLSAQGKVELVNAECIRITGVSLAESADPSAYVRVTPPEDHARQLQVAAAFLQGEVDHYTVEKRYVRPDGGIQWAEMTSRRYTDPVTGASRAVTTLVDLTQRKAQEALITKLSRQYLVRGKIDQVLVRAKSRDALVREICSVLVEVGKYPFAWVGWLNALTRLVEPAAVAGDDQGYVPGMRLSTDAAVQVVRGPSGTALREGRTYVCNDFLHDPLSVTWRERACRNEIQSTIVLPLRCEGRILGLISVYAAERDYFGASEVEQLEAVAADVSFALEVFAGEERRKRAEAELRKLSLVVEQSPASIMITNLDGVLEYVNPRFTETSGYTMDEVRGQNPRVIKSALNPPAVYQDLWRTITRGKVWRGELINRKKNGESYTELMLVTPVRDAQGRPTHYIALKEDITARVIAERKLRQLSRAVEQAPLSILITDPWGVIEYANPHCFTATGYTEAEVLGQDMRMFKSGQTPPETYADMWQALHCEEVWRGVFSNRKKNGEIYHERAVIAPITDDAGKVTHYVALKEDITQRMIMEAALQDSQKLYRLITDNTSDVIWMYDPVAARFTYCSPAVVKLRGYTPEEVLAQRMDEVLTPESDAYLARVLPVRLARFAAGDHSAVKQIDQVDQVHRDGSIVTTEIATTLLSDADGRVTQILGVTRDITARVRSEEALRESEEQFREVFDLGTDAILVHELESGRIVMANQAASQSYGYAVEHLLTLRPEDLSDEPEATKATHRQIMASEGTAWFVPCRLHRRADGTIFPVEISMRIFRRRGQLLAVAALRDITLQQQARAKLERFNEELEQKVVLRTEEIALRNREIEALLKSIPDLVLRMKRDGTVINFQPAKGSTPLSALVPAPGDWHGTGLPESLLKTAADTGASALAGGATTVTEGELHLATGPLTAEFRASPIGREEYVVFVRDITDRKQLEAETSAMLEKEREVSEMKTRFISVASHEFRTPITAAMVTAELLASHHEHITPTKRQEMHDRIHSSLYRLTEMLDDVLTLSRMDANRTAVRLKPIDLSAFMQGLVTEAKLADREAHACELHLAGDTAHFVTDVDLLRPILSNLLSNAMRYSPAGTVVTARIEAEPSRVTMVVEDQGIGVPEEDRARIFEAFERGSNIGNIKGTGLGLSIVKRMTLLLGGTIEVASPEGGGTRFILIFPRTGAPALR